MEQALTWGALTAAAVALLAILNFWISFTEKIGRARGEAALAKVEAATALAAAKSAETRVMVLDASLALHKERVAELYVRSPELDRMKDEIMAAVRSLGDRMDRFHREDNAVK